MEYLPSCFVRVDVAHVIIFVGQWKCLHPSSTRRRVRQFYIRAVGQLILCSKLSTFKEFLTSIFITALSENEGINNSTGEETACEKTKKMLLHEFSFGLQQSEINRLIDNEIENSPEENTEKITEEEHSIKIKDFINQILCSSKAICDSERGLGDRDNLMYMPELINPLKILCYR